MKKNNDVEWKLEEMEVIVEGEGNTKDVETRDIEVKDADETLTIDHT